MRPAYEPAKSLKKDKILVNTLVEAIKAVPDWTYTSSGVHAWRRGGCKRAAEKEPAESPSRKSPRPLGPVGREVDEDSDE